MIWSRDRGRKKKQKDRRKYTVTDEPMFIDPSLLGMPLATPLRRGVALLVDLVLVLLLMAAQTAINNHLRNPHILKGYLSWRSEESPEKKKEIANRIISDVIEVAYERNASIFPGEIVEAIEKGDRARLADLVRRYDVSVEIELDSGGKSFFDEETGILKLRGDVINGMGTLALGAPAFFFYFTLIVWTMKGKTPGKALAGIRIIRLDGKRLTLWNSFGRAAGYTASAATGSLGFLEAFWHPNRQTIHDRISGTVVVREKDHRSGERGSGKEVQLA